MIPMYNLFSDKSITLSSARSALCIVAIASSACMADLGFAAADQSDTTASFALDITVETANQGDKDFGNADATHASNNSTDQAPALSFTPQDQHIGSDNSTRGNGHSNRGNHHEVTSLVLDGAEYLHNNQIGSYVMGEGSVAQVVPLPASVFAGFGLLAGLVGFRTIRSRRSKA